jgi:hypothetical protein
MHYFNMSMAGVIFVLCVGADSMTARTPEVPGERGPHGFLTVGRLVRAGACTAALLLLVAHSGTEFAKQRVTEYHRQAWQEPIPGVLAFIQQNTTPADRIFTTGPPLLYAKADRISAVRESNIIDEIIGSYDGATDEERLGPIRQELDRNRPKIVVLDPEHVWHKSRTYRTLVMPFLADLRYQKVRENLYLRP